MEHVPTPQSTYEQDLQAAQERVRPLYEQLDQNQRRPSALRGVIDECIRRARPEATIELPDTKE